MRFLHSKYTILIERAERKRERNDLILSVLLLIKSITIPITLKLLFLLFFYAVFETRRN